MIVKATKREFDTLKIDGKDIKIDRHGKALLKDGGLGKEIETRYGEHGEVMPGQVVAIPIRNAKLEQGHVKTFTVPHLAWKDKE